MSLLYIAAPLRGGEVALHGDVEARSATSSIDAWLIWSTHRGRKLDVRGSDASCHTRRTKKPRFPETLM
jgi:hypothetical protein